MHDEDHALPSAADLAGAEELEGVERLTLHSVGIDIGSSTTHAIFSRLTLRRQGAGFSSRFEVAQRQELYRSPILLTPYASAALIDMARIEAFLADCYEAARLAPAEIDTGAVVITGEALKKENARPILEHFARGGGRFICASAGPMHEALLAAHGSGAVALSRHHRNAVLNVDIGGGTTKISVIRNGEIERMMAVEIGARLVAYDEAMRITRLEQPGRTIMAALGEAPEVGSGLTESQGRAVAEKMADLLLDIVTDRAPDPLIGRLMLVDSRPEATIGAIDHLLFSGGVSEYVHARESQSYGDLGPWLGAAIERRVTAMLPPGVLMTAPEGIRATVVGAGEYSLQASGSTSYIGAPEALPAQGLQVAHARSRKADSLAEIRARIAAALRKYDATEIEPRFALALSIADQPDYPYIRRIAEALLGFAGASSTDPLYLVLDQDVAKSLGSVLVEELALPRPLVVVDGIAVGDLDYLDIGRPLGGSEVIPITVKSLVFGIRSKSG